MGLKAYLKESAHLMAQSDDEIDFDDIPETSAEDWANPFDDELFRPVKKPVSLRLDAHVLAWFRKQKGYQTLINQILREYMMRQLMAEVDRAEASPRAKKSRAKPKPSPRGATMGESASGNSASGKSLSGKSGSRKGVSGFASNKAVNKKRR